MGQPARLLDGARIAREIRDELKPSVERLTVALGRAPGLGIVLAGEHPASEIYVRSKLKAAAELGIRGELVRLTATAPLLAALDAVARLNASAHVDGILVQSPLPAAMGTGAAQAVFDAIDPAKDVDGLSPVNVGLLVQNRATLAPGTPSGIIELLERSQIAIAGRHAVIIGRSEIVGKPMGLLLLHRDATVTLCHSKTRDLSAIAAHADILVAALGRPGFVRRAFVKPGATVIDVGVNRITDRSIASDLLAGAPERLADFDARGSVLVGDVHPEVADVAGTLTPVPGGVGPLTIAMLLVNTVRAAELRCSKSL